MGQLLSFSLTSQMSIASPWDRMTGEAHREGVLREHPVLPRKSPGPSTTLNSLCEGWGLAELLRNQCCQHELGDGLRLPLLQGPDLEPLWTGWRLTSEGPLSLTPCKYTRSNPQYMLTTHWAWRIQGQCLSRFSPEDSGRFSGISSQNKEMLPGGM